MSVVVVVDVDSDIGLRVGAARAVSEAPVCLEADMQESVACGRENLGAPESAREDDGGCRLGDTVREKLAGVDFLAVCGGEGEDRVLDGINLCLLDVPLPECCRPSAGSVRSFGPPT